MLIQRGISTRIDAGRPHERGTGLNERNPHEFYHNFSSFYQFYHNFYRFLPQFSEVSTNSGIIFRSFTKFFQPKSSFLASFIGKIDFVSLKNFLEKFYDKRVIGIHQ